MKKAVRTIYPGWRRRKAANIALMSLPAIVAGPLAPVALFIGIFVGYKKSKDERRALVRELDQEVGDAPDRVAESWQKFGRRPNETILECDVATFHGGRLFGPLTRRHTFTLTEEEKSRPAIPDDDLVSTSLFQLCNSCRQNLALLGDTTCFSCKTIPSSLIPTHFSPKCISCGKDVPTIGDRCFSCRYLANTSSNRTLGE